jgi:hypothetical protein
MTDAPLVADSGGANPPTARGRTAQQVQASTDATQDGRRGQERAGTEQRSSHASAAGRDRYGRDRRGAWRTRSAQRSR